MNSIQINCFLEAADKRSFSRAAAALFISQPTFSRNIQMLEEELGLTLFHRSSFHGIELTEAGRLMLDAFAKAHKYVADAAEKAHRLEQKSRIRMVLGLLVGQLLDNHLEEMLTRFRLEYPNVLIHIQRDTYKGLMKGLDSGEIDVVYMPEWQYQDPSQLQIRFISETETLLVIPKRLMREAKDQVCSVKDFRDYPFINLTDEESSVSKNMMLELFAEQGISPKLLEAGSIEEQIGKVEMGEGIILINPFNSICYSPNVHCVKIKELKPQPFAIAWKRTGSAECVSLFSRFLQTYRSSRTQIP